MTKDYSDTLSEGQIIAYLGIIGYKHHATKTDYMEFFNYDLGHMFILSTQNLTWPKLQSATFTLGQNIGINLKPKKERTLDWAAKLKQQQLFKEKRNEKHN